MAMVNSNGRWQWLTATVAGDRWSTIVVNTGMQNAMEMATRTAKGIINSKTRQQHH